MSFIHRELDRVRTAILNEEYGSDRYNRLHDVQQALAWALDPRMIKSAYESVMGSEADPNDYAPLVALSATATA